LETFDLEVIDNIK